MLILRYQLYINFQNLPEALNPKHLQPEVSKTALSGRATLEEDRGSPLRCAPALVSGHVSALAADARQSECQIRGLESCMCRVGSCASTYGTYMSDVTT